MKAHLTAKRVAWLPLERLKLQRGGQRLTQTQLCLIYPCDQGCAGHMGDFAESGVGMKTRLSLSGLSVGRPACKVVPCPESWASAGV